jgi:16S rRNA (uracil1498-N3)-methyltransferase
MPVFFIDSDQITADTVTITGSLLDHLRASLRVRTGERLWAGDEHRCRYLIEVSHIDRRMLRGRVVERRRGPAPSAPRVLLAQALLKGERMEWVIQKATELGAATIVPLVTEHTIIRLRQERAASRRERWQRIALEAAQQSERWDVPSVEAPHPATEFFADAGPATLKVILRERGPAESLRTVGLPSSPDETIALAIGPEGGWRDEELARAQAGGFLSVTLGDRILRAETATVAALSVIQSRLGELG